VLVVIGKRKQEGPCGRGLSLVSIVLIKDSVNVLSANRKRRLLLPIVLIGLKDDGTRCFLSCAVYLKIKRISLLPRGDHLRDYYDSISQVDVQSHNIVPPSPFSHFSKFGL